MDLIRSGKQVIKVLNDNNYEAFFVGGMVRDRLLNREIYDVDITTSATPEQVMSLFKRTIPTGLSHGTVTVMMNHVRVEVTTFRVESDYQDYRHPSQVTYTTSLVEDLRRRDFTMNAIASNQFGKLIDPYGGINDINQQIIKAVGDPYQRFNEDPLRMLRGLRFVSKLNFNLDNQTYEAMVDHANLIQYISKERIKKELGGLIEGEQRDKAMILFLKTPMPIYIDYFKVLLPFKTYKFDALRHSVSLFCLVGYLNRQTEQFLKEWPFSKEEKKMIGVIDQLLKEELSMPWIAYKYGEETLMIYHELKQFLHQQTKSLPQCVLPIKNRKDLAIQPKEVIHLLNKPSGPWIHALFEKIEKEIILNQLVNSQEEIIAFIRKVMGEENEK